MKDTLVVNLMGGPGVGKSTYAALLFSKLKEMKIDCELSSEFAKELVWEQRNETFKDELYIFAKQAHRTFRLNGKVDVIITDRPLILTCHYAKDDKALCNLCVDRFNQYNNLNYVLERVKDYNPNGRNQSEAEARKIDVSIKSILESYEIPYTVLPGVAESVDLMIKDIVEYLDKFGGNK